MELQGLQEALKVEIQCHQDGERKKPLDRQTRVTALGEKQKQALRGCPVGSAKPLSLIKPPSQSIAISVVPAKAPVSMVTAHVNGQKAAGSEPPQTAPAGLPAAGVLHCPGRRASEPPHSQILGTLTTVPIKVPQVRPKTLIPDSLPQSPGQEQQVSQPTTLQRATTVVSPKSWGPGLPACSSTFSPARLPNGQSSPSPSSSPPPPAPPVAAAIGGAGVAYAIISAPPSGTRGSTLSAVNETMKVQPLVFSTDSKVIIIQPQTPSISQSSPGPQADSPARDSAPVPAPTPVSTCSPALTPSAKKKKEEDPEVKASWWSQTGSGSGSGSVLSTRATKANRQKTAFMVALGLVTTEHLEEIQSKRQERKRRSTANPAYSGLFEPERKRHASNYLSSALFLSSGDSEDLCWKEGSARDDRCAVCKEDGELQPCHGCHRAYHPDCVHPPLRTPPKGSWTCPRCQKKVINKDNMSWPQNFVQSYVAHKRAREEEKKRLLRRSGELKKERALLEERDQQLSESLARSTELKKSLLERQKETKASLERLKALIRLIQRDHMIQVTMTATTTTEAPLLSLPWIKPASAGAMPPSGSGALHQKSVPQAQANK
ncbi:PHD finger protein 21B-like isoform X2 [Scleropages formosus]|uniref:PHD finger protein 21B-like isoform X2 n=1 Tax=Scleropages formosus TaxID=113540 RepID=UPI0010FAA08A|nr:PHD finger protein 21B-like isoform X2 [Scleropages formosus]